MTAKSISIVTCILGLFLSTFAVAAPFWIYGKGLENGVYIDFYLGLWHICMKNPDHGRFYCEALELYDSSTEGAVIRFVHLPGQVLLLLCIPCILLGSDKRCATAISSVMSFLAGACFVGCYVYLAVMVSSLASDHKGGDFSYHACFYADIVASVLCLTTCGILIKMAVSTSNLIPSPRINIINEDGLPVSARRHVDAWVQTSNKFYTRREASIVDDQPLSDWPGIPRSYNNTPKPSYSTDSSFLSPHSSRSKLRQHVNTLNVPQEDVSGHEFTSDSVLNFYEMDKQSDSYSPTLSIGRIQENLNF